MIKLTFLLIMIVLSYIDYKTLKIPNLIILPSIAVGMILCGNVLWSLAMFAIAATLYAYNPDTNKFVIKERDNSKHGCLICGGDVKLFAMVGAFMGIKAVAILVFTFLLVYLYRSWKYLFYRHLPMTPFVLVASVPFLFF